MKGLWDSHPPNQPVMYDVGVWRERKWLGRRYLRFICALDGRRCRKHKVLRKKLLREYFWTVANPELLTSYKVDWLIASIRERKTISSNLVQVFFLHPYRSALFIFWLPRTRTWTGIDGNPVKINCERCKPLVCDLKTSEPCQIFQQFPTRWETSWDANKCQMNCFPSQPGH